MSVLAAFIFFTRLPFWKVAEVPAEKFKNVISFWPLVGWLTGGIMAGVLWLAALIFPLPVAVLLAIVARLFVTGALHEDGLADFLDGFGGGTSRERTLAIMKDSHTGSYGVICLILYFLLLWSTLSAISVPLVCFIVFSGDAWSKFTASQLINVLPYARKEEESKSKHLYNRMTPATFILAFVCGAAPLALLPLKLWLAALFPVVVFFILYSIMKKKLQGYTGDCCGATFLLCELSYYLGALLLCQHGISYSL